MQSLIDALIEAKQRDADLIRQQACAKFDFAAVVTRTRQAIGIA